MKKKLIGFALFGTFLVIVGGCGGFVYYQKADKQLKQTVADSYQLKDQKNNSKLELNLSGDINYSLTQSDDEQIHITSEAYSPSKTKMLTWQPTEKSGKTILDVAFKKTPMAADRPINFDLFDNHSDYATISLPKSFETITINGKTTYLDVSNLTATDLVLETIDGETTLSNLRLASLTATSDSGGLSLSDLVIEKVGTITSNEGEIWIEETRAQKMVIKNQDERIRLVAFTGISELENDYGDIYLENLKGPTKAQTIDGDIYWQQEKITDDAELLSTEGDVVVDLIDKIKQLDVVAKTKNGDLSLLDKEKKTLKIGNSGPSLHMTTTYGDITLRDDATYSEDLDYYD